MILIRVEGLRFPWEMVRRIVGVIVEPGKGKLTDDEVAGFLKVHSDEPALLSAPSSGLFLERVHYPGEPRMEALVPVLRIDPE